MNRTGQWMWRHKIVSGVGLLLLVGSCSAVVGETPPDESDADSSLRAPLPPAESESSESEGPGEEAEPEMVETPAPAPTDEEIWLANYTDDEASYAAAVAAAIGLQKVRSFDAAVPLGSCDLLKKDRPVGARTAKAAETLELRRNLSAAQVFEVVSVATTYVCPEFADRHDSQVSAYEKAARQQARKDARQAAREQRREEARKRREEQRQAAANQPPPPVSVYYANCTDVRNAGAAPIYRGEPGYSSSLDRDGDGIACET